MSGGSAKAPHGASWMGRLSPHALLSELPVILGSHNSLCVNPASIGPSSYSTKELCWRVVWTWCKTQHLSLKEQLMAGIRFLDLRISDGRSERAGGLCHECASTRELTGESCIIVSHFCDSNMCLRRALAIVHSFQQDHPTECILVYLRKDYGRPLSLAFGKRNRLVQTLLNSKLRFVAYNDSQGCAVPLRQLARGAVLICGDELLRCISVETSTCNIPVWPASILDHVTDVWRCSSVDAARKRIDSCIRQRSHRWEIRDVRIISEVPKGLEGVALDGSFAPLPPCVTSPRLNAWFLRNWRDNPLWRRRETKAKVEENNVAVAVSKEVQTTQQHLGLCIVDFVTEKFCDDLLECVELTADLSSR